MSYYVGELTVGSTGNTSFTLPFNPSGLEFTIGQLSSGSENDTAHLSVGMTDGTNSAAHSIMATSAGTTITRRSTSYCLTHYAIVSGSTSRVISATLVSIVGTTVTLNFDRATTDYTITVKAIA